MKKWVKRMIAVATVLAVAFAVLFVTGIFPKRFSFDNGVKWGMTMSEVKKLVDGKPEKEEDDRLVYTGEVGGDKCDEIMYHFYDGKLVAVTMQGFGNTSEHQYLKMDLRSKYGDYTGGDALKLCKCLETLQSWETWDSMSIVYELETDGDAERYEKSYIGSFIYMNGLGLQEWRPTYDTCIDLFEYGHGKTIETVLIYYDTTSHRPYMQLEEKFTNGL